ncbi:FadR/GntR family transcriptional regulator [Histidinibacterium lentulum]|uniref:FadR family transcriptional regulator n=1 Tax=Histidinibacterium lentulum TaxID=2480588 RepID=A0A3N2R6D3_9RHOB|nr:FadR/GntR family transcriptional regulator [Histidinibacterium lentulum]ROU02906.1 FadR family transcriptional regulator [Histidinibacterium lentulum]
MIPGTPKPGRVNDVIGAVTRHIRHKDLMPGDRLPSEAALSKELSVSRPVVREALRSLAAMRIIELNTGRRATVAQIDHGPLSLLLEHGLNTEQINVQQIYDVRRTIEGRIVALAALRRTDEEAEAILGHARAMRGAEADPPRIMEHDLAFHAAIARASRNPVFALIVGAFEGITRQTWAIGWRSRVSEDARQTMLDTHLAMAEAIEAGDPVEAARLMALHFDESTRALLDAGLA